MKNNQRKKRLNEKKYVKIGKILPLWPTAKQITEDFHF